MIDFIPNSQGIVQFPTYLGYAVIKDDGVPLSSGTYTSYLMGKGTIGWAESPPAVPVEIDRLPAQGNGAGVEQLWTRRQYALHPYGFDWLEGSCAAHFPTDAELALAANWNRVYAERKQVNIARLLSKG